MKANIGIAVLFIFIFFISVVFCTHFSSRLAKIKGRKRVWGLLGFFLGLIGLVIVCYLPSKNKDAIETNPIKYLLSKIPSLSRKTAAVIIVIFIAAVVTVIAYDNIPKIIENRKHSKLVTLQIGDQSEQPNLITAEFANLFTGAESSYLLTTENKVYCWGKQISKTIDENEKGVIYSNAQKVLSNNDTIFVLDNEKNLYAMGNNKNKLIDSDSEIVEEFTLIAKNVIDFDISESTVGIIKTDNKLYMYGNNSYGQLSTYNYENKTEPIKVLGSVTKVCCENTFTLALQKSGDTVFFGSNAYTQSGQEGKDFNSPKVIRNGIIDIAAGDDFILLLTDTGDVLSCGANDFGQLGNTTNVSATQFSIVLQNISSIDAHKKSSFAISKDNALYAWGLNNVGQLGSGNTINLNTPTIVANGIKSVDTSGLHTLIITTDNKILSTGFNTYGQLGKGDSRDTFSEFVSLK